MNEQTMTQETQTISEPVMGGLIIRNSLCPQWPACMGMNAEGTLTGAEPFHTPDLHRDQGFVGERVVITTEESAARPGLLGVVRQTVGQIRKGTR